VKRSSGNGKWWLLFLVVCGIALWWRLHNRKSSDDTPPPPETPTPPEPKPEPPKPDAMVVEPPAPEPLPPVRPPLYESDYWIHAISTDGKRALLVEGTNDTKSLRVVTIETGKVEADVAMTAYTSDTPDAATLADEMVRARALLRGFPLGAGGKIAATPDGTAGAYQNGDDILPMRGDTVAPKLNTPAAYDPMFLDGKTLLARTYHGRVKLPPSQVEGAVDAEGVYSFGWATLDSPAVHEVDGTFDWNGAWALSESGDLLRIVARQAPDTTSCVVEIALTRPFHVTRKRCLEHTDQLDLKLSPHGKWVAWPTRGGDDAPARLRTMNVETGEIGIDISATGDGDIASLASGTLVVTDGGRLVAESTMGDVARTVDPQTKEVSRVTLPHAGNLYRCLARGDRELVCEDDGSVSVVKF
jgi:hypothetical protein